MMSRRLWTYLCAVGKGGHGLSSGPGLAPFPPDSWHLACSAPTVGGTRTAPHFFPKRFLCASLPDNTVSYARTSLICWSPV